MSAEAEIEGGQAVVDWYQHEVVLEGCGVKDTHDLSEKPWDQFGSFRYFCISKCDFLSNWGRGWALAVILGASGGK